MSRHHSAAEYVAALTASGGLVAPAARSLRKSRQAVYDAAARHPEVKQALEDARAELLDACEANLFRAVKAGTSRRQSSCSSTSANTGVGADPAGRDGAACRRSPRRTLSG